MAGVYVGNQSRRRMQVAIFLDEVAEILMDGKWHNVHLMAGELNQPEERIWQILKFLEEFNFMTFEGDEVRLDEGFMKFIVKFSPSRSSIQEMVKTIKKA